MKTRSKSGMALPVALVFMVICALVCASFFALARNARNWSNRDLNREQAFSLAEAAVELAAENLITDPLIQPQGVRSNVTGIALGAGTLSYSITSTTNYYQYTLDGTGTVNGVKRAVHIARAERPSFAAFALWMNLNNGIYFIGGDVFNGPVFSNDYLYFSPAGGIGAVFHDYAGSAKPTYGSGSIMSNVVFDKGMQYNAASQSMAAVTFSLLLTNAQNGLVLTGLTSITLSGTNAMITNPKRGWTNATVYGLPSEGIIYVRGASNSPPDVSIAGRLKGRLTVVADGNFQITNNITYFTDPRTNASSDALGMIAGGDITVMTNAPLNTTISAAMMATGLKTNSGSFSAQNYSTRSPASSGYLTVLGSIVQGSRGAVGTFSGGVIATGFLKNYAFDTRFSTIAPPYYPRLSTKVVLSGWWDESVQ
jgi:hypothetical protein